MEKRAYVYRKGEATECVDNPERLNGEDVLEGLELDVKDIH